ncbi:MAG: type II CRISPR RNA-guided endonuclease Cas9, partial [Clostridia bacterium]|nr:type II CRISPR RNA-guided endonuclease Cas9 [Clostridia bacterium]
AAKKEMIALLLGAKAKAAVLFGADYADKYKDEKISLKELNDDSFEQLQETFDEEHFEILKKARAIYNFIVFEKVLEGNTSIPKAMIRLYEKHAKDLSRLKKFVKENYAKEVYYKIFRSKDEKANYVNYIGYTRKKDKKTAVAKCNTVEEFYKFLKKTLLESEVLDENGRQEILFEIENETFLPKILNADNGLFPHQINGMELDLILNNLCLAHPEFNVKDESGYTAREKIEKIFRFKVPYFVGPLNANGKNGWIVRKAEGKITPWNFDEMVDKGASNEQFIRRMTNKCTYLHGKDVLPKGSMYYQAFDTLNQINKLTINGAPISVELKQELFKNVYLKNKKVGKKQIEDYLVVSGRYTKAEVKEVVLGGFDVEVGLKASMSSYVLFKGKFGDFVDERPEIFEEIILWHTLNTDKTVVEDMIKEKYADIPQIQEQIKWIKGLTAFKEIGRFSKELLCSLSGGVDPVTGEIYTLLHQLYHTNYNLNQLLNLEEYTFDKAIQAENSGESDEVKYSDVESLYVSPMVRRGIWQALQMADEYVKAVGRAPDKIFIEVTRQDGEKKRTVSRKAKLLELYRAIAKDCKDVDDVVKELNREDMTESRLRSERLYLYFLQLGRCAYTGERIDIEQLSTDLYDVDHIVPRSLIKDDSLENKVLVKREKNAQKTDVYPLPVGFTDQQESWRIWKKMGFMSEAKYARLTRTKPLSDDDFKDFVNRQLVVTNQMAKAVAELLERKYAGQGTKIVYSKAVRVDEFKQRTGIVKCRETNDLHHARDAYLNIVVGNIYDTKFTSAYSYYYQKPNDFWREYNLKHLFDRPILGAWSGAENIEFIKTTVQKTSMKVTRYAYCDKGKFYKETIYGKNDKSVSYPRKGVAPYNIQDDKGCYKYGGYSNVQGAYFVALEYADGKKRKKVILSFPVIVEYQAKGNVEQIKRYFEETEGLKDVKILVPKI